MEALVAESDALSQRVAAAVKMPPLPALEAAGTAVPPQIELLDTLSAHAALITEEFIASVNTRLNRLENQLGTVAAIDSRFTQASNKLDLPGVRFVALMSCQSASLDRLDFVFVWRKRRRSSPT
jgi:hypothetical protein